jgi:phage gpG-like protein
MAAKTVDQWSIDLLGAWRKAAQALQLQIGSVLQAYVERYFHTGMRPGLRLERGRIVGRGEPNRTSKLYRNTGRLARSFVPRSTENVLRIVGDRIEYGTRVPYAPYHEYGTSMHRPRPFLAPAARDAMRERLLEDIVTAYIRQLQQQ